MWMSYVRIAMSELSGMTVNERLFHKGLVDAFNHAARKQDTATLRDILKNIELDEQGITDVVEWVLRSPHSEHNRGSFMLSVVLAKDTRITLLPVSQQRIVQHLFQKRGRTGHEQCKWEGCSEIAVDCLAFCPYCAVVYVGLPS